MTDKEIEQKIFREMAKAHPVEMYATFPAKFWEFFRQQRPGISRTKMERLLKKIEKEIEDV